MMKPPPRNISERMMRLRSSSRCSIRLMPASSARSATALRARSTGSKSAMEGLGFELGFGGRRQGGFHGLGGRRDCAVGFGVGLGRLVGVGAGGVVGGSRVGDGQSGGRRQDAETADD